MDISFSDRKLERLANDDQLMVRQLGSLRARKLKLRLSQLAQAENLEDVRHLPGNYHELTGDRKGQWACDLDQPYRLIFTPQERPIPENASGQYIWLEITAIEVVEIVNYHKEY